MINNLNIILPLLEFKEEEDFYHLLILKRRKDSTTNKSNEQSVRTIKTYTIRSKEYLEEKFEEIQLLCEAFKARAYINLNRMNDGDVALKMIEKLVHCLQNKTTNVKGVYDSVVGNLPSKEKRWLTDLDEKHLQHKQEYIDFINISEPVGKKKIITEILTKNGIHIITHPFNTERFCKHCELYGIECPDIQKNNPTLLYIPRALFTGYSLIDTLKSYEQIITAQIGKENWEQWIHHDLFYKNELKDL